MAPNKPFLHLQSNTTTTYDSIHLCESSNHIELSLERRFNNDQSH